MLFLVWTNSSVFSDNTKLRLAVKKFKCITKHQYVTSKHNKDQSITCNLMDSFLFQKQNISST